MLAPAFRQPRRTHMKSIAWLTGAALMLAGPIALAQDQERYYFGIGAGASDIDRKATEGLITSGTVDGSDSGMKFFGGYRFGPNLALELAYVDLGTLTYSGDFSGLPVTGGKVKMSGFNTSLVGLHPVNPRFDLFAKAGLIAWNAKASDVTGGVPFSAKDDGVDLSFGLGANYYVTKNVGARLEWEHFATDPGASSLVSASLVMKF
jgi:OOP family OmpA-OmpF porin